MIRLTTELGFRLANTVVVDNDGGAGVRVSAITWWSVAMEVITMVKCVCFG